MRGKRSDIKTEEKERNTEQREKKKSKINNVYIVQNSFSVEGIRCNIDTQAKC
jgi:hypothetical protein